VSRVVFLPDSPIDRPGDRFLPLVRALGIDDYAIDAPVEGAAFVAYVGKRRAGEALGRRVRCGRIPGGSGGRELYVLPSTAPEQRGSFYEGIWRSFASRVLGRDLAVRDEFKGLAPEEVKARLDARRFPFAVMVVNLVYDFNLATVVRNANAFLAEEVWIFGRRRIDAHGAMGAQRYETIVHVPDEAALDARLRERGYAMVCLEETPRSVLLADLAWPPRPLMVFGQEGAGIPDAVLARAAFHAHIPMLGSMRSLNVGVASGVAMWAWHGARAHGA